MLAFWLICALLIAAALLIVLPPLLAKDLQVDLGRQSVNRAIYDRKLGELEEDLERDLIDKEQFEAARSDLKRTLIDDLEGYREPAWKRSGKLLPVLVLLAVPAMSVLLYLKISNGLPALDADFQVEAGQQGRMPPVQQAVGSLERKLENDPGNLDGWVMLGRSYLVLGRPGEAVRAFGRAHELSRGTDPDVLVAYAEAQALASGQQFGEKVVGLLAQALQIDPGHERGLWYAGYAAYHNHDYPGAVSHWEKLLRQVPSDQGEVQAALQTYLNDARQKVGMDTLNAVRETGKDAFASREVDGGASIVVQVSISGSLREKISESDTLFVYARALNGPRMPLALARMTAASLPATVMLDDSLAMVPSLTLSSMQQVEVIARISKSGKAMMQPGDLYGSAQPVDTRNSGPVNVVISGTVP